MSIIGQAITLKSGDNKTLTALIDRSITSVIIPEGVTSIGTGVFFHCYNLANVEIPESVTFIGDYAFSNCPALTSIKIPEAVTSIGMYAFSSSSLTNIEIPAFVTSIKMYAFSIKTLTEVTFKGTPTSLNSLTFGGCTALTTVNVPWAEDEIDGAPWGATNATINYNYTAEE